MKPGPTLWMAKMRFIEDQAASVVRQGAGRFANLLSLPLVPCNVCLVYGI